MVTIFLTAACAAGATPQKMAQAEPAALGGSDTNAPASTPLTRARTSAVDRTRYSTTDPSSIWVVVNKSHPITPLDFRPDLAVVRGYLVAATAADALRRMLDASDREGLGLKIASAFRSYSYQQSVHALLVSERGDAAADAVSARAGYSEHQTGLAVDIVTPADTRCAMEPCFGQTAAGKMLANQAWRFGFVIRYTKANQAITGYSPEPWHLRYVGKALAKELHTTGIGSLEEFFGTTGGPYLSR